MTVGENKPKVIVIPAAPKNTGTAEQRQLRVAAYHGMERTQHSRSCGIGQDTLQGKNTGAAEKRDRES